MSHLKVCSAFWKSPVIGWDGELTVCTRDSHLANRVGNVREHRFSDLWWGPSMASRRRRVERKNYEGLPPCGDCFIPRSANYSELDAVEIQRQSAWDTAMLSNLPESAQPPTRS